jgi:Terminase RNaseH-like domain
MSSPNEISLPHKFEPREYQLPLLEAFDEGYKRLIYVAHRRAGKDKIRAAVQRVGTYFYILPTYSQAKKVIWDSIDKDGFKMLEHIPKRLIDKANETEMQIELKNGSIIQLVGADNVDRIVGTNPVGVVFSEYALIKPEVWDLIRPILAENGGWAIFNFTPRGMNHAYALMCNAKENPEAWWVGVFPVSETGAIKKEDLEQEQKEMPRVLYEQEYECKFLEGASQFFKNLENCVYGDELALKLPNDGEFKLGVDLAKYNDFTVITPFNMSNFIVYPQDRFNQVDWILQEAKIEATARRFNNARITLDSTGIGDPVVEELRRRGLNIREEDVFKFTQTSRQNLLNNLAILLENAKIKIPKDEGLLNELKSFTIEMNDRGKAVIKCPDGLHDDRVMSLALAVWGVDEPQREDPLLMQRIHKRRDQSNPWY